ncbi:hypothetical protein [Nocardioides sp. GCM10030258]|uniref:hypothetical protein n=1 Tax=unclassified Nocardioides TaxID=2615069 RepID=UPI0036177E6E
MTEVQRPPESLPMKIVVNVLVAVIMIIPLVLVGSGLWLLGQRQFGEKVEAEVLGCDLDVGYKKASQYCTARWTQDGVVHTGPIQGSGDNEVGDTITATVRGDELYSRSLGLPLILLGLGLPFSLLPISWVRRKLRRA